MISRALSLEMSLRAAYLATGREENFFAWVDAGILRLSLEEAETERIEKKYAIEAAPNF